MLVKMTIRWWPGYLLAELRYTVRSCSRHDVVAAGLTSERPGAVISVSKTFTLLEIDSYILLLCNLCFLSLKFLVHNLPPYLLKIYFNP